jgi:glycosyltransferase involved in cell wall biosynthesis
MKNLDVALTVLKNVKGIVKFNIYGPIGDEGYWRRCQQLINELPPNIDTKFYGEIKNEQVDAVMRSHHLFFLPTRGENFGHVIAEALLAGCPVLISDRTPWRGLEKKGIGWDLPLDRVDLFQMAIEQCLEMNDEMFGEVFRRVESYAHEMMVDTSAVEKNRILFSWDYETQTKNQPHY